MDRRRDRLPRPRPGRSSLRLTADTALCLVPSASPRPRADGLSSPPRAVCSQRTLHAAHRALQGARDAVAHSKRAAAGLGPLALSPLPRPSCSSPPGGPPRRSSRGAPRPSPDEWPATPSARLPCRDGDHRLGSRRQPGPRPQGSAVCKPSSPCQKNSWRPNRSRAGRCQPVRPAGASRPARPSRPPRRPPSRPNENSNRGTRSGAPARSLQSPSRRRR